MKLTAVRFPIPWDTLGFPSPFTARGTVVAEGDVAWAWDGEGPGFGIPEFSAPAGVDAAGWEVDHLVLLVPDVEPVVEGLAADLRLRMEVRGRPTAFFRVGTVLEVIETEVPEPRLYGLALAAGEPLEDLAARWRSDGHDVSDPRDAIQPGRRIFTVRGLRAGLVVMDLPQPE